MKFIFTLVFLVGILFSCSQKKSNTLFTRNQCSGGANCHACKNCKYCKHCAENGGTCSVCK